MSAATLALLLTAVGTNAASAATHTYRYFRFKPVQTRNYSTQTLIQISEFKFFQNGVEVPFTGVTVTDPSGLFPAAESPNLVFNGVTTDKWLNTNFGNINSALVFDFGDSKKSIDSYNFYTGGDAIARDPAAWKIEGSDDNATWVTIDSVTGFSATRDRNAIASPTNLVLPATAAPTLVEFGFADTSMNITVKNGTEVSLYAETLNATSATLVSSASSTPTAVTNSNLGATLKVTPPNNTYTTYTFTATSAGGSVTKTVRVRTVAGTPVTSRYVRFTPTKTRGGFLPAIQLGDFSFYNGDTKVTVASLTNTGGSNAIDAAEGANKLIDADVTTKWLSNTLTPVVFDFGSAKTFDRYAMFTGNDFIVRDPVQWTLETSDDNTTWTIVDNLTNFDYPIPTARSVSTGNFLLGATATAPTLTLGDTSILPGDFTTLSWAVPEGSTVSITPSVGDTSQVTGLAVVTPTATTTYTATVTAPNGFTASSRATVYVGTPTGTISYANFNDPKDINLIGAATTVNAYGTYTNSGDERRLRLNPLANGQTGSAWVTAPVRLSDGFDTTFRAQVAYGQFYNGADSMSFIIQNTPETYRAVPAGGTIATNAVSVVLDGYANDGETNANVQVWSGGTRVAMTDISSTGTGAAKSLAKGNANNYLAAPYTADPYKVRVVYVPGALSVYVDNVLVIDSAAVNLVTAGAVDSSTGKGYVGFNGRTGGLSEVHEVVDWKLSSTTAVATNPLAISNSSFNFTTNQLTLTWSSNAGKTYNVTHSADLVTWDTVATGVASGGTTTSTTVGFTKDAKGFFRVEQTN